MDVDSDGARQILTSLIDSGLKTSLFLGLSCIPLTMNLLILFVENLPLILCCGYVLTGNVDLSDLLSSMDDQIVKAKEQALSRKDILDKLEKCKFAFEEDKWLDEYEKVNIEKVLHLNIMSLVHLFIILTHEALAVILLWKLLFFL